VYKLSYLLTYLLNLNASFGRLYIGDQYMSNKETVTYGGHICCLPNVHTVIDKHHDSAQEIMSNIC